MKQYLLAVHHADRSAEPTPADIEVMYAAVDAFNAEVKAAGLWVFAGGLQPPSSATVVNATGTEVITTDGPFAETKEQMGGFWIITAPDLDEALAWAAKGSRACGESVEVRPFQDEPEQ